MQDFQEVIEDSQLMNAMYDDTPRPIQEWYQASQDEMEIFESKLRKLDNNRLEIDFICTTSLGFFLASSSQAFKFSSSLKLFF
jgi:hypothetical protein